MPLTMRGPPVDQSSNPGQPAGASTRMPSGNSPFDSRHSQEFNSYTYFLRTLRTPHPTIHIVDLNSPTWTKSPSSLTYYTSHFNSLKSRHSSNNRSACFNISTHHSPLGLDDDSSTRSLSPGGSDIYEQGAHTDDGIDLATMYTALEPIKS